MRIAGVLISIALALALQTTLAPFVVGGTTAIDLVLVAVVYIALTGGPVSGMLAGSVAVGMHVCHGTLRGLALHLLTPEPRYAGAAAVFVAQTGDIGRFVTPPNRPAEPGTDPTATGVRRVTCESNCVCGLGPARLRGRDRLGQCNSPVMRPSAPDWQ